jgi:hypothetical protein
MMHIIRDMIYYTHDIILRQTVKQLDIEHPDISRSWSSEWNDFADVGGWVLQSNQLLVQSTCFELQHASTLLFTAVHPP